jgi:tetratricopeptide (TPR) repeat protein
VILNDDTTFKPESHSTVLEVDDTFAKSGNYQQAISDYNKAIELNPKYAKAYYN